MKRVLRTPAKLNLGLEIVSRRHDGYHDLATVFQAIDLYDEFHLDDDEDFHYVGPDSVAQAADIVGPLLVAAAVKRRWTGKLTLVKRIPISAGLGGGSSDAALALRLAHPDLASSTLRELAASVGADVPFFIDGGAAYATGTGNLLEPLNVFPLHFAIVTPEVDIPNKTATLFRGLIAADFSSGERVKSFATDWRKGEKSIDWLVAEVGELPNAFARQMLLRRKVRGVWEELRSFTGRAALSGAGPSVYSWHATRSEAQSVVEHLRSAGHEAQVASSILQPHGQEQERNIESMLLALGTSG